jgi:hypothetical protein
VTGEDPQLQQEAEARRDAIVAGRDVNIIHVYAKQENGPHLKASEGVPVGQHVPPLGVREELQGSKAGCLIIHRLHAKSIQSSLFTVFIDGTQEGKVADDTTVEFNVTPGVHTVQVRSGGFESVERTVVVETSCTLTTEPDDARGQAVTELILHPMRSGPEGSGPGSFGYGCLLVGFGLLGLGLVVIGIIGFLH